MESLSAQTLILFGSNPDTTTRAVSVAMQPNVLVAVTVYVVLVIGFTVGLALVAPLIMDATGVHE